MPDDRAFARQHQARLRQPGGRAEARRQHRLFRRQRAHADDYPHRVRERQRDRGRPPNEEWSSRSLDSVPVWPSGQGRDCPDLARLARRF